jgi:ATP-dependent exoDNAse (exonuclease V) alpha subunit
MAIFYLDVKYISRNQGRSSVAAAAYRSGEKLHNKYDGLTHDFTKKKGIVYNEILLPDAAPREFFDREKLWNAVEEAEKRKDARTAREVVIALPNELTLEEQINLARQYATDNFVSQGMCADVAIHQSRHPHRQDEQDPDIEKDKDITPDNPHAHILLTTRPVDNSGFSPKKNREWDKREKVLLWREQWANTQNQEYERKGLTQRVSHESYIARGIDREPTEHLGHKAASLERRGIRTEIGDKNRAVMARNKAKKERELQREQERERSRGSGREQERNSPSQFTATLFGHDSTSQASTNQNHTGRRAKSVFDVQHAEEAKTRAKAKQHINDIKEQAEKDEKAQAEKERIKKQQQEERERRRKEERERNRSRGPDRDGGPDR